MLVQDERTPPIRVISPVTHLLWAIYEGYNSIYNYSSRGPSWSILYVAADWGVAQTANFWLVASTVAMQQAEMEKIRKKHIQKQITQGPWFIDAIWI